MFTHESPDGNEFLRVRIRNISKHVFEHVAKLVGMTDTPLPRPQTLDSEVILCRRVNSKPIQKGSATSAGILSTLNDSLQTMPEVLVGLYLSGERKAKGWSIRVIYYEADE